MKFKECIISSLSQLGSITDEGIDRIAVEWGFAPASTVDADQVVAISRRLSSWIDDLVMHPSSVGENGHSASWDKEALQRGAMLKLRMYGITPSSEFKHALGVSIISDATNKW